MTVHDANTAGPAEEPLTCIQRADGGCDGEVEMRESLSGTGEPIPRCTKHWAGRLDAHQRLREVYPDSSTPPSWFDPSVVGEHWDDDY